jgi:hypothetical protein
MNEVPGPLLREALQASMRDKPDRCVDAEMLARFVDGELSRKERADVEAHAARCARCQAVLAAMERTAPPAPSRSWFRAATLGWIVPLTAAAVLLVWLAIPNQDRRQRSVVESDARVPTVATAAAPPSPIAPPAATDRDEPKLAKKATTSPRTQRPQERVDRQDAKEEAPSAAEAPAPVERERLMAPAAAQAAPKTFSRAEGRMMLDAARPAVLIASPVAGTRWRISRGPTIERTVDGGATWEQQDIGVSATPTAGASPSPLVCWLIGSQGLVLLTTDGHAWKRVPFPDRSDLMWVKASDAKTATVSAQDGGTWTTQDGGATWTRP